MPYNKEKMLEAVKLELEALGIEETEHSTETPERIAVMNEILLTSNKDPKDYIKLFAKGSVFPVMQKEIPFYSFCAHHHLPFYGKASVMYVPNETNIGLSKLARIVRYFAKGYTTQEILTTNIAKFLKESELKPKGVAVIIDSTHTCMTIRGVRAPGVQTRTYECLNLDDKEFDRFLNYVGTPTSFGY
jgi:GTP cyclohydrolase I